MAGKSRYSLDKMQLSEHEELTNILASEGVNLSSNSIQDQASQLNSLGLYFSTVMNDPERALLCHVHALEALHKRSSRDPVAVNQTIVECAITMMDISRTLIVLNDSDGAERYFEEARILLAPFGESAMGELLSVACLSSQQGEPQQQQHQQK